VHTVDIIISNSNGSPIYEQIYSQIKNLILTGELKQGDPGKGSFVGSNNLEFIREEHLRIVEENLMNAVESAKLCDYSLSQMIDYLTLLYEEN